MIRLHCAAKLAEGVGVELDVAQSHYLKNVMRVATGDHVLVFNAEDGEFEAAVDALSKKSVAIRLLTKRRDPDAPAGVELLCAPVKRAALETIVQKATELGVDKIGLVTTARTNSTRVKAERLQAIAIEASEQCGRVCVPRVELRGALKDVINEPPGDRTLIFCDEAGDDASQEWGGPEGRAAPMLEVVSNLSAAARATILIGPEGGFSPDERASLRGRDDVLAVTLGPRILRADTAAIVALSLWQAACGDLRRP